MPALFFVYYYSQSHTMLRNFVSALLLITIIALPACKDKQTPATLPDEKNIEDNTVKEEVSIAGNGYLQLELKVDGTPIKTDSAKYTVHDVDGLRLESWGERIPEGPYGYTYTLEMRLHSFKGEGNYAITGEAGTMFWQYKSFYVKPDAPGNLIVDNWKEDRIEGQFEFIADDGYGSKKRIEGRFFQR